MRVAVFAETFLPKWDGIANTISHLLEHLSVRGHDSIMFAPKGAPARYARTPIIGLPSLSFPLYPSLKLVPPTVNVDRPLTAFRPDLVHLVNPAFLGLVGLSYARRTDTPVVASYHTDIPGYAPQYGLPMFTGLLWAYFRWLHNQAGLNLCPSRFTKEELLEHGFQRVRVWGHGVDTERFSPCHRSDEWRRRLSDGHSEAPLLLYVGRLATEKRVDWLLPVLKALPPVHLAIVGDGPSRAKLESLFAGTPTVFVGYLDGMALSRAYASADMFVSPSANETFGNVVLEAMASGLPVVVPNSGGPVDYVRNWETGLLFSPVSTEDMVRKVAWLVSRPDLARGLGARACAYARTQSWRMVLHDLLEAYAATIRHHRLFRSRAQARRREGGIRRRWQEGSRFPIHNG